MGPMPATVVLLHGFAGTGHGWDLVVARLDAQRYTALAPDIRGHGHASDLRPVTFGACVADVLAVAPERFELCGYSLGGRLALHVALAAPDRVSRLILVSATAGIEDERLLRARRESDAALATAIESATIGAFADRWLAGPLFADDPPEVQRRARADIERNEPAGLAAALRGIGTGVMEPLWDRLPELAMPVDVVAGASDARYVALGERLVAALPQARLVVVPGVGHALPRAAPAAVADVIAGT